MEGFWILSQAMASFAFTFQLRLWCQQRPSQQAHWLKSLSGYEKTYLVLYEARLLYLPHWGLRYLRERHIPEFSAVTWAIAHFFLLIVVYRHPWSSLIDQTDKFSCDLEEEKAIVPHIEHPASI